jgi:parvulin-like peptidyl-prolyl isomerase
MEGSGSNARARWLLGIGAVVGLALATGSIVETAPSHGVPDDAAALVNGVTIRRETYARALAALAKDSRDALSEADRSHVLDRLVEEELLVQRAQALGLDRTDPVVRNTLVSAMIESVVAGVGQEEPTPEAVERFYEENREFFARSDRFWVRQLRFPVNDSKVGAEDAARARAEIAARRLRNGDALEVVGRELSAGGIVPLPDGFLPAKKLREYLGPTPARAAIRLATGEVGDPVRGGSAWHVLKMVERASSPPLPLEAVEAQVRSEMRRRAGDESLRRYLEGLRDDADVRLPTS